MARIVLSIPHASTDIPPEVQDDYAHHVNREYLRLQGDIDTGLVYRDLPGVRAVEYPWHRFFADPNRGEEQESEGGVCPTHDFDGRALYVPGREPDAAEKRRRVLTYHRPHHERLRAEVADPRTAFVIDAHSMAPHAPSRSPDRMGELRPDAVVSNLVLPGAEDYAEGFTSLRRVPGEPLRTCPQPLTRAIADRLAHWMRTLEAPAAPQPVRAEVRLNDPFPAGHGVICSVNPAARRPGVQLELNQGLWTHPHTHVTQPDRVAWMREVLIHWLRDVERLRDDWASAL